MRSPHHVGGVGAAATGFGAGMDLSALVMCGGACVGQRNTWTLGWRAAFLVVSDRSSVHRRYIWPRTELGAAAKDLKLQSKTSVLVLRVRISRGEPLLQVPRDLAQQHLPC